MGEEGQWCLKERSSGSDVVEVMLLGSYHADCVIHEDLQVPLIFICAWVFLTLRQLSQQRQS